MKTYYHVSYRGIFGQVDRYFRLDSEAREWTKRIGHTEATIIQESSVYFPLTMRGNMK